jgi:hypothetical protein
VREKNMPEPIAPEGKIYVCCACGKTSRGLYGTDGHRNWDESCMMNAVLANEADLVREDRGTRVIRIDGEVTKA